MSAFENYRTANWFKRINRLIQIVLSVTFIAGLNYMATRHYIRNDLTRDHLYSLSPETLAYVRQIEVPVKIIVTIPPESEEQDLNVLYRYVRNLLSEYEYAGRIEEDQKIKVEFVDVYKEVRKADTIARRYNINQPNVILVVSGEKQRRLLPTDILELTDGTPTAFRGEQAFTTAIMEVTNVVKKKIYFLTGHGEMSLDAVDPRRGLSQLKQELIMRSFALSTLDLAQADRVPDDADLVILASPQGPVMPQEQEKLRVYLSDKAGRLIVMAEPWREHGLDELFREWGIKTDDMLIIDTSADYQETSGDLLIRRFAEHPITDILLKNQIPVVMGMARPVRKDPEALLDERLTTQPLMATSEESWAEYSFRRAQNTSDLKYDQGVDLPGPVSIAAVSERRVSSGLIRSISGGRLLVFGNADLISNQRVSSIGNYMLFFNAINWCLDRDNMLSIPPRPIETFHILLSRQELNQLGLVLLTLPGLMAILGITVYWIRKH